MYTRRESQVCNKNLMATEKLIRVVYTALIYMGIDLSLSFMVSSDISDLLQYYRVLKTRELPVQ